MSVRRRSSRSGVQIRRAYASAHPNDGYRVLVDRLWPRGRTKASVQLNAWAKELAPSTRLRTWFGHDPARWAEFKRRYGAELSSPERRPLIDDLVTHAQGGWVTLVYAARDERHNEARVIAERLKRRLAALRRESPSVTRPKNGDGQPPSRGPDQAVRRLHKKMRGMHGAANRRRAEAEAQRVLATADPASQRQS